MLKKLLNSLDAISPAPVANAHCDGPCGVYDPISAKLAAEAVKSMMDKIQALKSTIPEPSSQDDYIDWQNHMTRYVLIKEEQAELCKREILILFTDAFTKAQLGTTTTLYELFWDATKACSNCKHGVKVSDATNLLALVAKIKTAFDNK